MLLTKYALIDRITTLINQRCLFFLESVYRFLAGFFKIPANSSDNDRPSILFTLPQTKDPNATPNSPRKARKSRTRLEIKRIKHPIAKTNPIRPRQQK